jgi:hypothetical protein
VSQGANPSAAKGVEGRPIKEAPRGAGQGGEAQDTLATSPNANDGARRAVPGPNKMPGRRAGVTGTAALDRALDDDTVRKRLSDLGCEIPDKSRRGRAGGAREPREKRGGPLVDNHQGGERQWRVK